jgi:hypothetical protein
MLMARRLVLALLFLTLPGLARAQAKADADSLSSVVRLVLSTVATASHLARLDSASLAPGVTREIRVYIGFGLGQPDRMIRVWQDTAGTHGAFGLFWKLAERLVGPGADARDAADLRAFDTHMRILADSVYGCNQLARAEFTQVCWLPPHPTDDWLQLLARLDTASIDAVPRWSPPPGLLHRTMRDGWGIVVELRTRQGYRVYDYENPSDHSADPGTRAAAVVAEIINAAWTRRRGKC